MRYLVVDDCTKSGNGVFVEEFETEEEAISRAENKYYELKDDEIEFKKRTTLYVLESSNPDENAEDHLDGKLVRGYIIGGRVGFIGSDWNCIEDYMEYHDLTDLSAEEIAYYADEMPDCDYDDRLIRLLEERTPLRRFMYVQDYDREKFEQDYEEEKDEYESIVDWYDENIGDLHVFLREYDGDGSNTWDFIVDACGKLVDMESSSR